MAAPITSDIPGSVVATQVAPLSVEAHITKPSPVISPQDSTEAPTPTPMGTPTTLVPTNTPPPPTLAALPNVPILQNKNEDNADPTPEPTATPEPTSTPDRCLQGPGTFEICITDQVTAQPTPKYPELFDLSIPIQETERKQREARERGDAQSTVDVPNLFVLVIMEDGESIQSVVDYLEENGVSRRFEMDIEDPVAAIMAGTVAIYDIYDPPGISPHNLYAVIPATLVRQVNSLDGVQGTVNGISHYHGINKMR